MLSEAQGGQANQNPAADPEFELVRVAVREEGAFGVLKYLGLPFALTLERTLTGGQVVIPPGDCECRRTRYHKGGYETFEVPVAGHNRVLFHVGNVEDDSAGCILVGLQFGQVQGRPGVQLSRLGFQQFMRKAGPRASFLFRVREVPHA